MHDAGVEFDLEHTLSIRDALDPCRWVPSMQR